MNFLRPEARRVRGTGVPCRGSSPLYTYAGTLRQRVGLWGNNGVQEWTLWLAEWILGGGNNGVEVDFD